MSSRLLSELKKAKMKNDRCLKETESSLILFVETCRPEKEMKKYKQKSNLEKYKLIIYARKKFMNSSSRQKREKTHKQNDSERASIRRVFVSLKMGIWS